MSRETAGCDGSLPTVTRRAALSATAGGLVATTLSTRTATAQQAGTEQWAFETGDGILSSPTVVNGTVFIGSNDENLYAVDAETGEQRWVFETAGNVRSSPTVVDGIVFVGSYDGNLYAIDAEAGTEQWTFETEDSISSSPTVVDGTILIGSWDNNLYAVNAETGERQWNFETDDSISTSSPAVVDGTVYIGSHDHSLYAVAAEDGDQQWQFETDGNVASSPTILNDTVYIGSVNDHLYAVDADSGEKIWSFETGTFAAVRSSPTVSNGTVFVGSGNTNENLYALTTDLGEERWSFDAGREMSSPTVADGTVFIGGSHLFAVDAETGAEQWMFTLENETKSSPTVADGTVFIGSNEGTLYAVNAGDVGSGDGSRGMLGTLGHHDTWRYADQSIELPGEENDAEDQNTTSSSEATTTPGPSNGLLAVGLGGIFISTIYAVRRRMSDSDTEEFDQPAEPTLPIEDPEAAGLEEFRAAADAAIETAMTAHENGDFQDAIQPYEDAIVLYQAAVDELDTEDTNDQAKLTETIESTRENLREVKTLHEQRTNLIEAVKPAERSFQEAIVAAAENDQTIARIRFQQARDSFEDAIGIIQDSDDNPLATPLEVIVQPGRELSSTTLGELPAIPKAVTELLADIGIKTVNGIESSDEGQLIPTAVKELEAHDEYDEAVMTTLTLLSWWNEDGSHEFDTVEAISRRQQQAEYGFDQTS